jgi:hypothetical protein
MMILVWKRNKQIKRCRTKMKNWHYKEIKRTTNRNYYSVNFWGLLQKLQCYGTLPTAKTNTHILFALAQVHFLYIHIKPLQNTLYGILNKNEKYRCIGSFLYL